MCSGVIMPASKKYKKVPGNAHLFIYPFVILVHPINRMHNTKKSTYLTSRYIVESRTNTYLYTQKLNDLMWFLLYEY